MKKIIPFKKEISFNDSLYELNSISLEHNLKLDSDNTIKGEFILSGDYKKTEYDINCEPFIYNIPIDIDIDYRYDIKSVKLDIEDFNYNIIEPNIIEVSINLLIDGIELEDEIIEEIKTEEDLPEDRNNEEIINENVDVTSIISSINEVEDNYVNYKVHIYRENDSIDNLLKTYNISKEELEEYNDLSSIIIGSKIIIPYNE